MEKTGVFISYSHENKELRDEIVNILSTDKSIEVYYDDKDILIGHPIHEKISAMLDLSHIVIALITGEWLLSHEAREEFIRANERRKYLVCFADSGTNLDSLPQFIRDARQIRFTRNTRNSALSSIIPAIQNLTRNKHFPKQYIHKRIQEIGDEIHKSSTEFYRLNLAYDHIEHALEETKNILGRGPYSIDIGNENGYLLKAISIFESASNIYAVSLTGISTFWDDKKYESKAIQYLERQSRKKDKIIRLFVFSNYTQVNDYKNILYANHKAYGQHGKGAVLICSKRTYEEFLKKITRNGAVFKDMMDDDFGILSYIDANEKKHFIEARLDNNVFKFRPFEINHVEETGINRFIKKFEEIDECLKHGEFLGEHRIMRWDPSLVTKPDVFADKTRFMFADDEKAGTVLHLAVFKNCTPVADEVEEGLFELVNKLKNLNGRFFNFKKVELLTKADIQAFDGKFGTELLFNDDINYIMMIEFANEKYLKEYYTHTEHSNEREKIYSIIKPGIIGHYNELKTLKKSEADYHNKANQIYTRIEKLMAEHFFRLDIRNFEIPEQIFRQRGIPFAEFDY